MITAWTRHIQDPEEKIRFESSVIHAKHILKHLSFLLDQMDQDLGRAETNPKTYDIPNWDYRQAHNNGYRQALNIVRKLINLDQKEE